mmetsp:Transcript_1918/g.4318  ORF Transcript_1918/g.4318 Transcript_1918/m.4318 type:complete len:424 (+) Transcript_1918:162-1433(+)|eukprot:CAMPEP_0204252818 /NCGR_PEP_ID=MMETSP0468-20130131/1465_1 /ASSEMBLY_ACC=CAM_ASM_000383 /TAXON_ID=2969 /ORGANISM="Oxyrrhis marina" /LENGTH=423 /DNA_ID=CAMNT_0051226305 /DNA_START=162 /DNA_END=1433 /DNA_ORIENTATION=+
MQYSIAQLMQVRTVCVSHVGTDIVVLDHEDVVGCKKHVSVVAKSNKVGGAAKKGHGTRRRKGSDDETSADESETTIGDASSSDCDDVPVELPDYALRAARGIHPLLKLQDLAKGSGARFLTTAALHSDLRTWWSGFCELCRLSSATDIDKWCLSVVRSATTGDSVLEVLWDLRMVGTPPSASIYEQSLKMLAGRGAYAAAVAAFAEMVLAGNSPSVDASSCLVSFLLQDRTGPEMVVALLRRTAADRFRPSVRAYMALVQAVDPSLIPELLEDAGSRGCESDAVLLNISLRALVRGGLLDVAVSLLAQNAGVSDVISVNTVVGGLVQARRANEALSLVLEYEGRGVEVNDRTFQSLARGRVGPGFGRPPPGFDSGCATGECRERPIREARAGRPDGDDRLPPWRTAAPAPAATQGSRSAGRPW